MNNNLRLSDLQSVNYQEWAQTCSDNQHVYRVLIATSGYEERGTHFLLQSLSKRDSNALFAEVLVIGFQDYRDVLSRPANDRHYSNQGIDVCLLECDDSSTFLDRLSSFVREAIESAGESSLEVHIDYSCMPRDWYCNIPMKLQAYTRPQDQTYFWYTPGHYPESEYPSAGVEDFNIFSGRPNLSASFRTHLFGLGFDRVRSQAIWSVLDPQNLITYHVDPAIEPDYATRVVADNRDVLLSAQHQFTVPLDDFVISYSKIRAMVYEFRKFGDVIIVPDGPKPVILASSLIPYSIEQPGVVCFHVTRRKLDNIPLECKAIHSSVGFSFKNVE